MGVWHSELKLLKLFIETCLRIVSVVKLTCGLWMPVEHCQAGSLCRTLGTKSFIPPSTERRWSRRKNYQDAFSQCTPLSGCPACRKIGQALAPGSLTWQVWKQNFTAPPRLALRDQLDIIIVKAVLLFIFQPFLLLSSFPPGWQVGRH